MSSNPFMDDLISHVSIVNNNEFQSTTHTQSIISFNPTNTNVNSMVSDYMIPEYNYNYELVPSIEQDDAQKEAEEVQFGHENISDADIFPNGRYVCVDGKDYYYPIVDAKFKPIQGAFFTSMEAIEKMYYAYAKEAGFDVRKTTNKKENGVIRLRYLVCNRQGAPNTSAIVDTLDPKNWNTNRRSDTRRTECNARIRFKVCPEELEDKWLLYEFVEEHNHPLIAKENMVLCRANRQLDYLQKSFIYRLSNQGIGATIAHRLFTGIQGDIEFRGATKEDFKNYMRDLNCFIGGTDAQMVVDKMKKRKENVPNFSFEYRQEGKQLNALFWADETSKINFNEFGDLVSFDATYSTNRYHMVFVPFTGIDNHKKCVTFGAGLLSREDTDSYVWLLYSFKKAFGKQPRLILSDQDPAMKKAIMEVFPQSNHRLCMWHITSKLSVKVSSETFEDVKFKTRFNSLIWNSRIDEETFEKGWEELVNDYNLHDNKWFKDMHGLRHFWIPAFFKDVPLSGLMRTTSRSESSNSAFNQNMHYGATLVNFMNSFEEAMEKQRKTQTEMDFKTNDKFPVMRTPMEIERNAAKVYTKRVFRQVQYEILKSLIACSQFNVTIQDGVYEIIVMELMNNNHSSGNADPSDADSDNDDQWDQLLKDSTFKVTYNKDEATFKCQCMKFEHFGVLCSHIFCVMKTFRINEIPSNYILRRWRKDIIPSEMLRKCFRYGDSNKSTEAKAIDIFSSVDHCVSALCHDEDKLSYYLEQLKLLETKVFGDLSAEEQPTKSKEFEQFLGVTTPPVVDIENPSGIRTKGCGTRKRIKSAREITMNKKTNEPRACDYCKQPLHDWRNCEKRKADEANGIVTKRKQKKKSAR